MAEEHARLIVGGPDAPVEFRCYDAYHGPEYGPESSSADSPPDHVADGVSCASTTRSLMGSGTVTYEFIITKGSEDRWELWRISPPLYPDELPKNDDEEFEVDQDTWILVGYTRGQGISCELAVRNLLIGHIGAWSGDYEDDFGHRAELSGDGLGDDVFTWSLVAGESAITEFESPEPGPRLIAYLNTWQQTYPENSDLLGVMLGDDPARAMAWLRSQAADDPEADSILEDICEHCQVDRDVDNPLG